MLVRYIRALSFVLKVLASIIGVGSILYGFVGILGISPHGPEGPGRLLGLFVFVLGVLYLCPNSLVRNTGKTCVYIVITSIPCIFITWNSVYVIILENYNSLVFQGGLIWVGVVLPLSILAPISLILYLLAEKFHEHSAEDPE
jgi:hypothetical protein